MRLTEAALYPQLVCVYSTVASYCEEADPDACIEDREECMLVASWFRVRCLDVQTRRRQRTAARDAWIGTKRLASRYKRARGELSRN
jgi:hypothetical protein